MRVEASRDLSVYHLVPMTRGLDCIDRKAIYFKWSGAYPEEELRVSYPVFHGKTQPARLIRQQWEYSAWTQMLDARFGAKQISDGRAKAVKSCDLLEELKKNLPRDAHFHYWIANGLEPKCVASCRE